MSNATNREPATGKRRERIIFIDKLILGFTRRWALWIALIIGIYSGLPWVAPIAMNAGYTGVGRIIYTLYGPFCHQFVFRSWLIGGEQAAYPRARANSTNFDRTFEEMATQDPYFQQNVQDVTRLDADLVIAARAYYGSDEVGYKTALCQRDLAIYTALTLSAVVFGIIYAAGRKVPYLPFWAYVLFAIVPIGLDGFSQLFANPPMNGFGLPFYPIRESTPFLRTLTGALFGLGNGWLAFPYVQDSMVETGDLIVDKLTKAGVLRSGDQQQS